MRRVWLVIAALLALQGIPQAQAITKWTLRIYNSGAQTALSTTDILPSQVTCGQAKPTANAVNPGRVFFDDVTAAGKVCIWTDTSSTSGPLTGLPFGASAYELTVSVSNSAGTSGESSPRVPFTRPGVAPGVPTGVGVAQ